jgi:hypothetical protein
MGNQNSSIITNDKTSSIGIGFYGYASKSMREEALAFDEVVRIRFNFRTLMLHFWREVRYILINLISLKIMHR